MIFGNRSEKVKILTQSIVECRKEYIAEMLASYGYAGIKQVSIGDREVGREGERESAWQRRTSLVHVSGIEHTGPVQGRWRAS